MLHSSVIGDPDTLRCIYKLVDRLVDRRIVPTVYPGRYELFPLKTSTLG